MPTNPHRLIDVFRRRLACAVLVQADMATIRQRSLANLDRWEANGVWCSAHDEWRELMANGTDDDIIAVMTGLNENADRLRQSSPYSGIVDDVTRAYLLETKQVGSDGEVLAAYPAVDARMRQAAAELLRNFDVVTIREKSLGFLERLEGIATRLSPTHEEWKTLLSKGTDDEILAVMTGDDVRAVRLRLVNPFADIQLHLEGLK